MTDPGHPENAQFRTAPQECTLTPDDLNLRLLRGQGILEGDLARLPQRPLLTSRPPLTGLSPDLRLLHLNLQCQTPEQFVHDALQTLREIPRRVVIRPGSPDPRSEDERERGEIIIRTLLLVHLALRPDALEGEAARAAWDQHAQLCERWTNHDNGSTIRKPINGLTMNAGLQVSEEEFGLLCVSMERARANLKDWNPNLRLHPDHDTLTWLRGVKKAGTVWARVRTGAGIKLSGEPDEMAAMLILGHLRRHDAATETAREKRRPPPLLPLPRLNDLKQLEERSPWNRGALSSECGRMILALSGLRVPSIAPADLRAQVAGALATQLRRKNREDLLITLGYEVRAITDEIRRHVTTISPEGRKALAHAAELTGRA